MHDVTSLVAVEDAPLNSFHKRLLLFSSGGQFLDGYILSMIGIALLQATPQLGLSPHWQGLIGSSALMGIFFGGFLGGYLADKFGRQKLYTLDLMLIVACSIAQWWVNSAESLFIMRLLMGVAVGADYPIAAALMGEFAPRRQRGQLVGAMAAFWFVGAILAYFVGAYMLQFGPDAWRWMLVSSVIPATAFLIMRHNTPESPKWLAHKGRKAEAEAILHKVYGPGYDFEGFLREEKPIAVSPSFWFRTKYGARLLFVAIFWSCTITPQYAVDVFSPTILQSVGLSGNASTYGSAFIMLWFFIGGVAGVAVINRVGRRPLLLQTFFWSALALVPLGLVTHISSTNTLLLFSTYALFTGACQILVLTYPNELFPTKIRGTALGLSSSLSRIGAVLGTYMVPWALATFGTQTTMLIAVGILGFGWTISYLMAPETGHLTLEEAAQ